MVTNVFSDCPTAVKKGQDCRSGEIALIKATQSSEIDRVLIWSIDRMGKSLADLAGFIEACRAAYVALNLYDDRFALIARPRMDYRNSMSPRFWRTTCDNRGGIAYYADRPLLALSLSDLAGRYRKAEG
jgi:hypothetical protein